MDAALDDYASSSSTSSGSTPTPWPRETHEASATPLTAYASTSSTSPTPPRPTMALPLAGTAPSPFVFSFSTSSPLSFATATAATSSTATTTPTVTPSTVEFALRSPAVLDETIRRVEVRGQDAAVRMFADLLRWERAPTKFAKRTVLANIVERYVESGSAFFVQELSPRVRQALLTRRARADKQWVLQAKREVVSAISQSGFVVNAVLAALQLTNEDATQQQAEAVASATVTTAATTSTTMTTSQRPSPPPPHTSNSSHSLTLTSRSDTGMSLTRLGAAETHEAFSHVARVAQAAHDARHGFVSSRGASSQSPPQPQPPSTNMDVDSGGLGAEEEDAGMVDMDGSGDADDYD